MASNNQDDWQEMPAAPQSQSLNDLLKAKLAFPQQNKEQLMKSMEEQYTPALVDSMAMSVPGAGGVGKVLAALAEKTGLSKIPGALMEKAVGLRRSIPGAGDELINQGIRGSKDKMLGQIAQKLPEAEAGVQKAVSGLTQPIDSVQAANRIAESLGSRMTSSGKAVSGAESQIEDILARAKDVAARGDVSPKEALELARGAQKNAFQVSRGEMKPGLMPELGRAEGGAYKDALKEMSPEVAQGLKAEQAMIEARKGLERPSNEGITSTMLRLIGRSGPGGVIGTAVGGPVGGAIGGMANYAATTPGGLSAAAHLARGAGNAAVSTADPLARLLGSNRQAQSTTSVNNSPEQDDWQEVK